jgi:hypothetical protein
MSFHAGKLTIKKDLILMYRNLARPFRPRL